MMPRIWCRRSAFTSKRSRRSLKRIRCAVNSVRFCSPSLQNFLASQYLAVLSSASRVGIYDAATLEHLAELQAPISIAPSFINFSNDGRWLNLLGTDQTIQRWDLVALREELTPLGLNW